MSDLTTSVLIEIRDAVRATNERLDGATGRLDALDARLESVDARLESVDARLESVDARLAGVTSRLDTHERVLIKLVDLGERHERVLGKLVTGMDSLNARFDNFLTGVHQEAHQEERRRYDDLDARVSRLEAESHKPG